MSLCLTLCSASQYSTPNHLPLLLLPPATATTATTTTVCQQGRKASGTRELETGTRVFLERVGRRQHEDQGLGLPHQEAVFFGLFSFCFFCFFFFYFLLYILFSYIYFLVLNYTNKWNRSMHHINEEVEWARFKKKVMKVENMVLNILG